MIFEAKTVVGGVELLMMLVAAAEDEVVAVDDDDGVVDWVDCCGVGLVGVVVRLGWFGPVAGDEVDAGLGLDG